MQTNCFQTRSVVVCLPFYAPLLRNRKFSKWISLLNHGSALNWLAGMLEGRLSVHDSWTQGGASGQNLGHSKEVFFCFSVMETTYADSWSDMTQPFWHGFLGHEVMVNMTYISQSSDFALYLEDYLMYENHTLGLWAGMTRHSTSK